MTEELKLNCLWYFSIYPFISLQSPKNPQRYKFSIWSIDDDNHDRSVKCNLSCILDLKDNL